MPLNEKRMAHARECVRLAGLTDDGVVRDQLIALARDWLATAMKEEEDDDNDNNNVKDRRHQVGQPAHDWVAAEDNCGKVLTFPSRKRASAETSAGRAAHAPVSEANAEAHRLGVGTRRP
jgi:hypothetical protein